MTDFSKLASILSAKIGDNDETQGVRSWLNSGYAPLNHAISGRYDGGFPVGRIIEIYGPSSSGKTHIATQAMIAAQKAGGVAAFHDHERSFDVRLARRLGLDTSGGRWVFKTPRTFEDSIMSFMQGARAIRESGLLPKETPLVWVFDSLASMIPQSQLEKEISKQGMADQTALARATSLHFKVIASLAEEFEVCVIFLNQMREKPGVVYGDNTTTPGGNAPKFYASVRLQLSASRVMKGEGDQKEMIGSEVTCRVVKNKVNRPFLRTKWRFVFRADGSGYFDVLGSLVDTLLDKGVLERDGKRIKWSDGKLYYRDALVTRLEGDDTAQATLEKLVRENGIEADYDQTAEQAAIGASFDTETAA